MNQPLGRVLNTPIVSGGIAAAGMKALGQKPTVSSALAWGGAVRSLVDAWRVLRGEK